MNEETYKLFNDLKKKIFITNRYFEWVNWVHLQV